MNERDQAGFRPPKSQGFRFDGTKAHWLAATLLTVAVFLLFFPTLQPIGIGLDESWRFGLSALSETDYFRDTPIIFTYGSLGYLVRGGTTTPTFSAILIFRAVVYCLYFGIVVFYLFKTQGWVKKALLIAALLVSSVTSLYKPFFQTEFQLALIPVLLLSLPIKSRGMLRFWHIVALGLYAGVLLHTKTSLASYSAPFLFAYLTGEWLQAQSPLTARSIVLLSSKYFTAFFAFIVGSSLVRGTAVPRDLALFTQISSGYSAGMSQGGSAIEMTIATMLLTISLAFTYLLLFNKESRNIGLMLALDFLLLIMFKHAFVRQGHSPRFFLTVPVILAISLTQLRIASLSPMTRFLAWGLSLATILGAALWIVYPLTSRNRAATQFEGRNVLVGGPSSLQKRINQQSEINFSKIRLSEEFRARIGQRSVDVIPRELSIVAANELNWRPRPTLQSYQGYTHDLDKINARHLAVSGPDFIIAHYDSLDAKHQSFYSPMEWLSLVCNYVPITSEVNATLGTLYLLERTESSRCRESARSSAMPVQWKQVISLDGRAEITVAHIEIKYTMLGKLVEILFRSPPLWIDVEYSDGGRHTYRFNHLNSSGGNVVSPLPRNASELLCSFSPSLTKCYGSRAKRITLWSNFPWMYDGNPVVQIRFLLTT